MTTATNTDHKNIHFDKFETISKEINVDGVALYQRFEVYFDRVKLFSELIRDAATNEDFNSLVPFLIEDRTRQEERLYDVVSEFLKDHPNPEMEKCIQKLR